jgi:flagellar hook-associated protein 1
MSDFSGLNTALSGLLTHRRAAEVAAHNIANVNTEGYSRQRAELQAATVGPRAAIFSRGRNIGEGVQISSISRARDLLLDRRMLNEQSGQGQLGQLNKVLSSIETAFAEPSDQGIVKQLGDFWGAWEDVGTNPNNPGARTNLLAQADSTAKAFNRAAADLLDLRVSADERISTTVEEINSGLADVARLNKQIRSVVAGGQQPNDLLDQRDLAIEKLAAKVGVQRSEGQSGQVNLSINGIQVVSEDVALPITIKFPPSAGI